MIMMMCYIVGKAHENGKYMHTNEIHAELCIGNKYNVIKLTMMMWCMTMTKMAGGWQWDILL